ncbi:PfkB family carbohydrate kinase [Sinobaca sp. H24]|uniref:PfkB family carbohydrate kinase n=1 Tax=Sinobaca sp. H24 TaxID=2923376 RepID=UPI00207ABBC4|nr:PfkB family carbohydrate kinase [Sinobaca sp. H24]
MKKTPVVTIIGTHQYGLNHNLQQNSGTGETIIGERFETAPGGKGANQAIAAARLGRM